MIEKRLAQWYAADAGVDLDIAEREIVLTYVLRLFLDRGILHHLAFKGGTAIRKLYLGNQGRFSLDLDFTAVDEIGPEDLVLEIVSLLHDKTYFGITFHIPTHDFYATPDSCGAEVAYQHEWLSSGRFGIQVSFRASPLLPLVTMALRKERYFDWLGIEPPDIPTLDLHEVIGEKIRAAVQRSRVRDLYDLFQLATHRFNRGLVRRIAVIKCWETNFSLHPEIFLTKVSEGQYDWGDLRRLVKRGWDISPASIIQRVQRSYAFLKDLTPDEAVLADDPYGRQRQLYLQLLADLPNQDRAI